MRFRGGEFSTGTMGNFQPELTNFRFLPATGCELHCNARGNFSLQSKSRRIRTQWKCWVSLPKKVEVLEMS